MVTKKSLLNKKLALYQKDIYCTWSKDEKSPRREGLLQWTQKTQ